MERKTEAVNAYLIKKTVREREKKKKKKKKGREKKGERKRQRQRQTDRDRDRQTETETERQRQRETDTQIDREASIALSRITFNTHRKNYSFEGENATVYIACELLGLKRRKISIVFAV